MDSNINNNIQSNNNKNNNAITLGDIGRVLRKNWILILIVTAFIFALGVVYTFAIKKPTYKSTSSIVVVIPTDKTKAVGAEGNSVDVTNSRNITYTIASTVTKTSILGSVAEDNGLTYSQLKNMVSASADTNTFLINISVTHTDNKLTKKLANEIAAKLISEANSSTSDNITALFYAKGYITQVDEALDGSYASPNKTLYLIVSALAGLVLALVVVFIKEFASNKFQTPEDVNQLGYPILNTLIDDKSKEEKDDSLVEPSIRNFEPYNRLISNIKFSNVDDPYKVILFTSTVMDELKTTVCSNFAYTLAHNEKKVVVIDLDTRKPRMHKPFGVTKENGIVEYLAGSITKDQLIKKTDKGVDVITVGKDVSNPVTLLESQKLADLIKELKNEYDFIALDTPPLTACNDAAIISRIADGVVFNVAINQGKKKEVKSALEQLKDADAKVIGINITKANVKDRGGYYYYYYYEYGDKK